MGANNTSNSGDFSREEITIQDTIVSEPLKEKGKNDIKVPIPAAEVLPVAGILTLRPQMIIGRDFSEETDTKEGEKLQPNIESKSSPDTSNEPRPQGQIKSLQIGLPEPIGSFKPSCWDSYARDHRSVPMNLSNNIQQKNTTSSSSHMPGEKRPLVKDHTERQSSL